MNRLDDLLNELTGLEIDELFIGLVHHLVAECGQDHLEILLSEAFECEVTVATIEEPPAAA
jgi:hypothetical protein